VYGDPLPTAPLPGSFHPAGARGPSDFVFLDGGKLLSAGSDRVLRVWDVASGRQVRAVKLAGKSGPGEWRHAFSRRQDARGP